MTTDSTTSLPDGSNTTDFTYDDDATAGGVFRTNSYPRLTDAHITIGALGIPGNILVIMVIATSEQMRKKLINLFILHQSVIDLLSAIVWILKQVSTHAT